MPKLIFTSDAGDILSDRLPSDTGAQAGGAGPSATVRVSGNLWMQAPAGGAQPGGTAADYVVAVATIPAGAFDIANRVLEMWAAGSFAANGDTKTVKIIVNPTAPVVGSAVVGGTTISSTGAIATNGAGWSLAAALIKTGANGSNTQNAIHMPTQAGAASEALQEPQALTLTEASAITVAVTINCATAASDAALWGFQGFWTN